MDSPTPEELVDTLLSDHSRRECLVCDCEPLARAVRKFLELKDAGDPRAAAIGIRWFFENKLRDNFPEGPRSYETVKKHVRTCLGRS